MASNQPVTYGSYNYGSQSGTSTLYANSFIAQTLTASLSDSVTLSDSDIVDAIKVLLDSVTMTDSIRKAVATIFADSLTMTDVLAKLSEKSFTDNLSMVEAATFQPTKVLADFLILKEWIAINLITATLWINPGANENSYDTLYGAGTYGPTLYGVRLYGGRRGNTGNWGVGQKRSEQWTNFNGHKHNI